MTYLVYTDDIRRPHAFPSLSEARQYVDTRGENATIFAGEVQLVASKHKDACDGQWQLNHATLRELA